MAENRKEDELTYKEVLHLWAETKIGVGKMPKGFTTPGSGVMSIDLHGTRQMCARIVETHDGYTPAFGELLIRFMFQGVPRFEQMMQCEDFKGSLAKHLIEHPVYFLFKVDQPAQKPSEYKQTELAKELGFKTVMGARLWMLNHGYKVPGVNQFGSSWYMVHSAFTALKAFRKEFLKKEQEEPTFLEDIAS
jgi:hypothetical protein